MNVYMIYNPEAKRYYRDVGSAWLFMHQHEATMYTNLEQAEDVIIAYWNICGKTLELHIFKLERIL